MSSSRRIIGIDPGSLRTGYGIVDVRGNAVTPVMWGVIRTDGEDSFPDRLHKIHTELSSLILLHRPTEAAVEKVFLAKNPSSALKLGQARGAAMLAAALDDVPVFEYAPAAPAGTASNYLRLSGTSTSAPLVTGAAALMLGEDPTLTPDDLKVRLMRTADPVAGAGQYQQGAGTLDVDEALADTSKAQGYALSAYVGKGKGVFKDKDYATWESRSWAKYGWTKFKWTKFKWTKFKWTEETWTKFKWTKFKWTEYEWAKFKWTVLLQGQ